MGVYRFWNRSQGLGEYRGWNEWHTSFRSKAGLAEEYARRHRVVWPELEELLRGPGIRMYAIYKWGDLVFSYMEVEDHAAMVRDVSESEVSRRWEREFENVGGANPATEWPVPLSEVRHLEPRDESGAPWVKRRDEGVTR